jgi:hypothetical protein
MVSLASWGATGPDAGGASARLARGGVAFRSATPLLRRFAALAPPVVIFFFMGLLQKACRDSPRQDSPFRTPCHALTIPRRSLAEPWADLIIRPMFLDSRKELTA